MLQHVFLITLAKCTLFQISSNIVWLTELQQTNLKTYSIVQNIWQI